MKVISAINFLDIYFIYININKIKLKNFSLYHDKEDKNADGKNDNINTNVLFSFFYITLMLLIYDFESHR